MTHVRCNLKNSIAGLLLTFVWCGSLDASFASPSKIPATKSKAAPKAIDWYGTLRLCEQQLAQDKFAEGANNYIKSLMAAESAKITCGDPRFVELMAVGDEVAARGSKTPTATSPPSEAVTNKLTETALKWKEHTAAAVCGQGSPPVIQAWQTLGVHYTVVSNQPFADAYQKKALTPDAVAKFQEVQVYSKAGNARSSAYLHNAFNSALSQLKELSKNDK